MRIEVSARHMELTDSISEYAEKRAEKLTKYYDRIQQIDLADTHRMQPDTAPFAFTTWYQPEQPGCESLAILAFADAGVE